VTKIEDLHRPWRRDAEYKEAYEALAEEFGHGPSLTDAGQAAPRSQPHPGKKLKTSQNLLRASNVKGSSTTD
jgi:hypothetical protein